MKRIVPLLGLLLLATPSFAQGQKISQVAVKPRMEIVFALDTTGSMGGLIDGAKKKIWSIVNQIVTAKPQPEIRVGFVGYRDKGDVYVTDVHDLTPDLDAAFLTLSKFQAAGGGDEPEHVNAGIHDAVTKMSWSQGGSANNKLYQVIFLVGDCPPHMDYNDGLNYKTDCEIAAKRGIIVNAIRCGNNLETEKYWLDISKRGMGTYLTLPQDGGTISIPTPYDAPMSKLSDSLESTTVAFRGQEARQEMSYAANAAAAPSSKAERAAFNAKSGQIYGNFDITSQIVQGKRKAESFKDSELPPNLAKMPVKERVTYLNNQASKQRDVQNQLAVLEKKRAAYINTQLAKRGGKNAFDQQMLDTFKKQAKTRGFKY